MFIWLFVISGIVVCYPAHAQAIPTHQGQRIECTIPGQTPDLSLHSSHQCPELLCVSWSLDEFQSILLVQAADNVSFVYAAQVSALPLSLASPFVRRFRRLRLHSIRGPPLA